MDYRKFTPEVKDSILAKICEYPPYQLITIDDPHSLCDDLELLEVCLFFFSGRKLVSDVRVTPLFCRFATCSNAYELMRLGGFTFEEEVLINQLKKANLELQKLEANPGLKDYVQQISGVTGIITNLISAICTFK